MHPASDLFKKAISQPQRELRIRCTIDGVEYSGTDIQSCSVEESILTDENFKFGSATASPFELTLLNMDNSLEAKSFENKEVHIEIGAYLDKFSRPIEYVSMGYFIVEKATKDNNLIRMTGYDRMILFETPYIMSTLTYPATLLQILQEICANAGVELESTSFYNRDYIVSYTPDFTDISLRQALEHLSELACGYAIINRKGKLEIISFNDTDLQIDKSNYYSMNLSEYQFGPIDRVVINNEGIIDEMGDGPNIIEIKDNIFGLNPGTDLLVNIYNVASGFTFKPFTTTWQGNVLTAPADLINVKYRDGDTYKSFIAKQKFTFSTGLKCDIETNAKTQMQVDYQTNGSVTNQLKRTKSQIKNLGDSIALEVERIDGELTSQSARIEVTAESITSEVSRIDEVLGEHSSVIEQTAEEISSTVKKGEIISMINQTAEEITIDASKVNLAASELITSKVEKGELISTINQSAETIQISASKIDLVGAVTFTDLDYNAQSKIGKGEDAKSMIDNWAYDSTYIDGANIYTGSIKAGSIDVLGIAKVNKNLQIGDEAEYGSIYFVDRYGGSGARLEARQGPYGTSLYAFCEHFTSYGDIYVGQPGSSVKVLTANDSIVAKFG